MDAVFLFRLPQVLVDFVSPFSIYHSFETVHSGESVADFYAVHADKQLAEKQIECSGERRDTWLPDPRKSLWEELGAQFSTLIRRVLPSGRAGARRNVLYYAISVRFVTYLPLSVFRMAWSILFLLRSI